MARGRTLQDPETAHDTQPEFPAVPDEPRTGSAAVVASRVRPVKRARLGVVVLTVLLSEIVLIGAGANQAVAKHIEAYAKDHPSALLGRFVRSLLVFRWRVSPGGHTDLWHTELITVGLVLLLGVVLVPMVVHGPVNWLRAFVGAWLAVIVGVVVATVAALVLSDLEESRDLTLYVVPGSPSSGVTVPTRIGDAAFGPVLSYAFVAGLALGLVVGLVLALVVVLTRRTDPAPVAVAAEPGPAYVPETPQPFFGAVESRRAEAETTALPSTTTAGATAASAGHAGAAGAGYAGGSFWRERSTEDAAPNAHDATAALPRVGTDRPPAVPPNTKPEPEPQTATQQTPVASETTQAWPAQPSAHDNAARDDTVERRGDGEATAAFPVPPDDEDLGHHPDRTDD